MSDNSSWRIFLRNHAHHLWAADLFTVPTLTFKALYLLVFMGLMSVRNVKLLLAVEHLWDGSEDRRDARS